MHGVNKWQRGPKNSGTKAPRAQQGVGATGFFPPTPPPDVTWKFHLRMLVASICPKNKIIEMIEDLGVKTKRFFGSQPIWINMRPLSPSLRFMNVHDLLLKGQHVLTDKSVLLRVKSTHLYGGVLQAILVVVGNNRKWKRCSALAAKSSNTSFVYSIVSNAYFTISKSTYDDILVIHTG